MGQYPSREYYLEHSSEEGIKTFADKLTLHPHEFKWSSRFGGKEVFLIGSFVNWDIERKIQMEPNEAGDFVAVVYIPDGEHQFKFLVDKHWKYSLDTPIVHDDKGNVNNYCTIIRSEFSQKETEFHDDMDLQPVPKKLKLTSLNTLSYMCQTELALPERSSLNHLYSAHGDSYYHGTTLRHKSKFCSIVDNLSNSTFSMEENSLKPHDDLEAAEESGLAVAENEESVLEEEKDDILVLDDESGGAVEGKALEKAGEGGGVRDNDHVEGMAVRKSFGLDLASPKFEGHSKLGLPQMPKNPFLKSMPSIYGLSEYLSASKWKLEIESSEADADTLDLIENMISGFQREWNPTERAIFLAKLLDAMDSDTMEKFQAAIQKKLLRKDFIKAIPENVVENVLRNLTMKERMMAATVSRSWRSIIADDDFWKRIVKDHFGSIIQNPPPSVTNFLNTSRSMKEAFSTLLRSVDFFSECAGYFHTCLVANDSRIFGFGKTPTYRRYKLGISSEFPVYESLGQNIWPVMVSVGDCHLLALTDEGEVYASGSGEDGRLGFGSTKSSKPFKKVSFLCKHRVVYVSAGGSHSAAVTEDGSVFTWGRGLHGQLGHGDELSSQFKPKLVESKWNCRAVKVSCGENVTLVLNEYGEVFACGGPYAPSFEKLVLTNIKISSISAGGEVCAMLTEEGAVYTCEVGRHGTSGEQIGEMNSPIEPVLNASLKKKVITSLSAGKRHFGAVDDKGGLFTWGNGNSGQLGNGSKEDSDVPYRVKLEKTIRSVSCGVAHTVAISDEGEVFSWGNNDHGQLGTGNTDASNIPVQVVVEKPAVCCYIILPRGLGYHIA